MIVRSELGVLVVLAVVAPACGPTLHLDPTGVTPQAKCGVNTSNEVSQEQAKCIAKLAGLTGGVRPWRTTRWRGETPDRAHWSVCNTLVPSRDGEGGSGVCIDVRISDGQIGARSTWEAVRVE